MSVSVSVRPVSHITYRPDIDGLRAVAVGAVIIYHAFPSILNGGFLGVDLFFVISGYLISAIILSEVAERRFNACEFYFKRIRRIFPALIVVVVSTTIICWFVLFADEFRQLGWHVAAGAGFFSNFASMGESGYFDSAAERNALLHLWSLSVEEQFYIVWPLAMVVASRLRFGIPALISLGAILSFFFNVLAVGVDASKAFYSPQYRGWEFLCGAALAWMQSQPNALFMMAGRLNDRVVIRFLQEMASVAGVSLIVIGLVFVRSNGEFSGFAVLVPALGAALVIAAGMGAQFNRAILSSRALRWVGLISYPLYLWHWPILSLLKIYQNGEPSAKDRWLAIGAATVLAWLTYAFLELPVRLGRHGRQKALLLSVLMFVLAGAGWLIFVLDGLPRRSVARLGAQISTAKSDWRYEKTRVVDGEIVGSHILSGSSQKKVLFIGNSVIGQYYSRIEKLYGGAERPYYTSIYTSLNYCTPLPDFHSSDVPPSITYCGAYYSAAMKMAMNPSVERVVFGGIWPNSIEPFDKFLEDIKVLSKLGKKVYLIAKSPISTQISREIRKGALRGDENVFMRRADLEDAKSLSILKQLAKQAGADVVNPFDYLCGQEVCFLTKDGVPLYRDDTHITSSYAEYVATFMDEILRQSSGGPY